MTAVYIQKGESIDYIPASAVSAGSVVVQGDLVGITKLDIPANTLGAVAVTGVFGVEKTSGAVTAGAMVYFNTTDNLATTVSSGAVILGKAVASAAAEDAVVKVLLNA